MVQVGHDSTAPVRRTDISDCDEMESMSSRTHVDEIKTDSQLYFPHPQGATAKQQPLSTDSITLATTDPDGFALTPSTTPQSLRRRFHVHLTAHSPITATGPVLRHHHHDS